MALIKGNFISSRVGRRIFWTLLVAAAVPILLLGAAAHSMLQSHLDSLAQRQRAQATKYAGMALLDNLLVARTVLGMFARSGTPEGEAILGRHRGRVLSAVVLLDLEGRLVDGDEAMWQAWKKMLDVEVLKSPEAADSTLLVGHGDAVGTNPPILLRLRDPSRKDRLWMAEVDREFLFGDLAPQATGERICVLDLHAHPLFCPTDDDLQAVGAESAQSLAGSSATWNLFLRSDFASADWMLVNLSERRTLAAVGALPVGRLVVLASLAALLIVIFLTLVQVRRTLVPLENLSSGTRRLAAQDFSARVSPSGDDEFGDLSRAFNHLAERLAAQLDALKVQSEIDRLILEGVDSDRILQTVVLRMQQLAQGSNVVLIESRPALATDLWLHEAGQPPHLEPAAAWRMATMPLPAETRLPSAPDLRTFAVDGEVSPTGQALVLGRVEAGQASCAVVVSPALALGDVEARELIELRDRARVALESADRRQRLVQRATRDSLTGLVNRSGLLEYLGQHVDAGTPEPMTLLFIDLDGFKEVNDTIGHQAGDELLRIVGSRLLAGSPASALVARPGGDEFVVILPGGRQEAEALAQQLVAIVAEPIDLHARVVEVGASVGLARYPDHAGSAVDLLRRADMAMYSVKSAGGRQWLWFEPTLDARLALRSAMRADLREALDRQEFELHYQPRVNAHGGVDSAEALLRWRHPRRGLVSPALFIDLLEEGAMIEQVGLWAIDSACGQLVAWRAEGLRLSTVAVNVSSKQLLADDFPGNVLRILHRHGLGTDALELEITESIFMGDSDRAISALDRLSGAGVRLALDDFGTGYSSLSYLHRLPIDILKVDRSFVCELDTRGSALAVIQSILALAGALRLHVVAEGVETERQAELLRSLGCDELQGYLFAKPLTVDDFRSFLLRSRQAVTVTQVA
jgi:diguanylate cyclase (GGDEF)-like protein